MVRPLPEGAEGEGRGERGRPVPRLKTRKPPPETGASRGSWSIIVREKHRRRPPVRRRDYPERISFPVPVGRENPAAGDERLVIRLTVFLIDVAPIALAVAKERLCWSSRTRVFKAGVVITSRPSGKSTCGKSLGIL